RYLYFEDGASPLFTENETNAVRIYRTPNPTPFVKDSINDYIVHGRHDAVNPAHTGTKVAVHHVATVEAGGSWTIRLRLTDEAPSAAGDKPGGLGTSFDKTFRERRADADDFYASVIPAALNDDERMVMRQALAGMLWSKQFYFYDVDKWLEEHGDDPFQATRKAPRNSHWHHMHNADVISMPDKWEYPWYAAWDLAFHVLALSLVDEDFAKHQLNLMLRGQYLHPNGQLPAYEWNFGDVNPPVHAWATLFSYHAATARTGEPDRAFLARAFQKLLLNFTWWVNRKDPAGNNLFEGGFLGLDNIGLFDRSAALPGGGRLEQADGTAWMAFFCQNMLEIALELGRDDPSYEPMVTKFIEHFLWIASRMDFVGKTCDEMWDDEDGFFYDVLRMPDHSGMRLKVRSMVGLLPLTATTVISAEDTRRFPAAMERLAHFIKKRPRLMANIAPMDKPGVNGAYLLSVVNEAKLRRMLTRMLDEERFFAPCGIRSLSRWHRDHPYEMTVGGQRFRVAYVPADSDSGMFGGNSNWRGPVWMPLNLLVVRALLQFHLYYGDDWKIEC